jgi:ATP-dependent helicase/nuclease subunit B
MIASHLVFGLWADSGAWPETAERGEPCVGSAIVGSQGLVGVLETALGLLGPEVPAIRRIAAMRAKLAAVGHARECFWTESFDKDEWATARELLSWRDTLVAAGWRAAGFAGDAGRLGDLAAAETTAPAMPHDPADRRAAVVEALATHDHPFPMTRSA